MRRLIILFAFISANCFGQSAIHFVDTNATWNVAKTYPGGDLQHPNFIETTTKIYGFGADTLIGADTWSTFYLTTDSLYLPSSNLIKAGYLRENNHVVLYMDTSGMVDTLYNFDLQPGDSVLYHFNGADAFIKVINTDSIIVNGSYRKRLFFSELPVSAFDYLHEIWIEGMGSLHGPLFPWFPTTFSTEMPDSMNLTCYKVNDSIRWFNPNYPDCFIDIILAGSKWDVASDISVFPNPVSAELRIMLPEHSGKKYTVSIYDLTGRLIFSQSQVPAGPLMINTGDITNSFYFLHIVSGADTYRTTFIKQ